MSESNSVILLRYYHDEQELDVFLNGNKLQTFQSSVFFPNRLLEMLEGLGYSSFEKQQFQSRLKTDFK